MVGLQKFVADQFIFNIFKFIAEVDMEMRNTVTRELIWSGSMRRIHNVYEGSYMHDAPARAAMRQALMDIFADYPNPKLDSP